MSFAAYELAVRVEHIEVSLELAGTATCSMRTSAARVADPNRARCSSTRRASADALLLAPLSDDIARCVLCFLSANSLLNGFGGASKRCRAESRVSAYWCALYCSRFHQQADDNLRRRLDWHAICRRAWCMARQLGRYCSWYQVDRLERGCWYAPRGATAHQARCRSQDGGGGEDTNVLPPPPGVCMGM